MTTPKPKKPQKIKPVRGWAYVSGGELYHWAMPTEELTKFYEIILNTKKRYPDELALSSILPSIKKVPVLITPLPQHKPSKKKG